MSLDFGIVPVLLVLGLVAVFGYYQGFISLLTRRASLRETRLVQGKAAIALGLLQLLGAIAASAVAILYYFSSVR